MGMINKSTVGNMSVISVVIRNEKVVGAWLPRRAQAHNSPYLVFLVYCANEPFVRTHNIFRTLYAFRMTTWETKETDAWNPLMVSCTALTYPQTSFRLLAKLSLSSNGARLLCLHKPSKDLRNIRHFFLRFRKVHSTRRNSFEEETCSWPFFLLSKFRSKNNAQIPGISCAIGVEVDVYLHKIKPSWTSIANHIALQKCIFV